MEEKSLVGLTPGNFEEYLSVFTDMSLIYGTWAKKKQPEIFEVNPNLCTKKTLRTQKYWQLWTGAVVQRSFL
jgi:hypothetical protein